MSGTEDRSFTASLWMSKDTQRIALIDQKIIQHSKNRRKMLRESEKRA